jgi:hypothetical protein
VQLETFGAVIAAQQLLETRPMVFPFHAAQTLRVVGDDQQRADRRGEAVERENLMRHRESLLHGKQDMALAPRRRWRLSDIEGIILTMSENR